MTWPTIFANLAGGNQPLALFDTMFGQVAQMVAIPCNPSGLNAITLTQQGTAPTIPNYQNFSSFKFTAAFTTTGPVTAQFGALGFLPVVLSDSGTQAGAGSIVVNNEYVLTFAQFPFGGSGALYLESPAVPAQPPTAGGSGTNVIMQSTTNTQIVVNWDELVMINPSGAATRSTVQSPTLNAAVNGLNGLDVGALAANSWYALFGISNGAVAAVLLSLSFSNPTMPGGYLYKRRIGAFLTDASAHLYGTRAIGNRAQYALGTNPTNVLVDGNGATGTYSATSPALSAQGVLIPPSAKSVMLMASSNWKAGTISNVLVAPNGNWGGTNNGPFGSNGNIFPLALTAAAADNRVAEILVENPQTVLWCSSAAGGAIAPLGWEDSLG